MYRRGLKGIADCSILALVLLLFGEFWGGCLDVVVFLPFLEPNCNAGGSELVYRC